MTKIGLVGAGASSAAAAYSLSKEVADAEIQVLEKSGGVCGRAATRRRGDVTFDYGANYLKDADSRVNDLVTRELDSEGLQEIEEPVWVFDERGEVGPGREVDEVKRVYRRGLTQLAKRLLDEADADVHRDTRVESLEKTRDGWVVYDDTEGVWGEYDAVVLNPPAPQTSEILQRSTFPDEDRRDKLARAAECIRYRTIYTAVLGYGFPIDRPYYGLVNEDKRHEVGWISREECKPGHVPDGDCVLVVQANHDWSVERFDEPEADNTAELARLAAEVLDDDSLRNPGWSFGHGWRYALTEGKIDDDALEAAEEYDLYVTGDWVAGRARLHAAVRKGLETGERVAEDT